MKKAPKFYLYIVVTCFLFSSCGMTKREAKKECYIGQVGIYEFDVKRTVMGGELSKDSIRLSKLTITFNQDSTFQTNMAVSFLDDTVGSWDAGTCGFEDWGKITFKDKPHEIQFSPCRSNDSFFSIIGQLRESGEGSQYLWFKKRR